jgi:putative acetyltransferase
VQPKRQSNGIGAALVRACIAHLVAANAGGIVLLGEPEYYQRFGFTPHAKLLLPGVPESHFLCLALSEPIPAGLVAYHSAFSA